MTVTYKDFIEQIATLYAFGMEQRDEWELKMWHRAISDKNTTQKQLSDAVLWWSKPIIIWEIVLLFEVKLPM